MNYSIMDNWIVNNKSNKAGSLSPYTRIIFRWVKIKYLKDHLKILEENTVVVLLFCFFFIEEDIKPRNDKEEVNDSNLHIGS